MLARIGEAGVVLAICTRVADILLNPIPRIKFDTITADSVAALPLHSSRRFNLIVDYNNFIKAIDGMNGL